MNKTIMIIEDDPETQFLFSEILASEGYDVVSSTNGEEAMDYIESNKPDLVFMDLSFPGGTPEEFTSKLRSKHESNIPLIVVSGNNDIQEKAINLHATAFLKKPFDIDPLLLLVQKNI